MRIFTPNETREKLSAPDVGDTSTVQCRHTMPTYTLGEYLAYAEKTRDKNEKPLRFELWQLREIARNESARYVQKVNEKHITPMPNMSPETPRSKYRKVRLSDTPTMAGNRVDNTAAPRPKKSRNRLQLPSGNYLLSLPKNAGVPLVVDSEGNVDVKKSLAFLDFYRLAIASGNTRKEDK